MVNQVGAFDVIKMIFILAIILVLTYYATKYVAAKASGINTGKKAKGIFSSAKGLLDEEYEPEIIHRMMIDRDTSIVVIEYNKCDYLLVVSPGAIELMEKRELTPEEISKREAYRAEANETSFDFSKYMDKYLEKSKAKNGSNEHVEGEGKN